MAGKNLATLEREQGFSLVYFLGFVGEVAEG